jgi:outer membrane receptor protein involved in Fe transport
MKTIHMLAASTLALVAALPATAQTTQSVAEPAAPARDAEQDNYESANDIVVTATRRSETVQEVPIAITAVGAQLLKDANVTDIRGLEQLAPSLQTTTGQSSATGSSLSIRGIGTAGDNPGFEPAVGVFIDGVFRARAGAALAELPELQRVEVLRGPQGTLFGRNTSSGALSIYTAQPQFDLGGYVEGVYGNYNAYELRGAITGPVSETIALRVDGSYRKRDGYIDDANSDRSINNLNRFMVRAQALYDTSTFSVRLIGDYFETDEQCCGAVSIARGPFAPAINAIAGAQGRVGLYTGSPSDRIQAISPNRDYLERVRDYGVSGEINFDIGAAKFTSITAYRDFRVIRNQDIDFSGIDRAYREGYKSELSDFTQELRLQGSAFGGTLDWLVGGFYLNEKNKLRDTVRFGNDANRYVDTLLNGATRSALLPTGAQFFGSFPGAGQPGGVPLFSQVIYAQNPLIPVPGVGNLPLQTIAPPGSPLFTFLNTPLTGNMAGQGNNDDNFSVDTQAYALFTHNIINLTDKLSLTLGARYNYEKKDLTANINNNTAGCGFFTSTDPRAATLRALIQGASAPLYQNLFLLTCNPAVNSEFNGNYTDDRSDSRVTGTAKLAYKFNPDILGYLSYDRGFKSGGYNLDQATFDSRVLGGNGAQGSDLNFNAETVDAYEVGLKTQWGRAFTFNIAAFYQKFKGLQSLVFAGNNFIVQNVEDATSKGVEVESTIQPVREWSVRLGYTYLRAGYDSSNAFAPGSPLAGFEGRQFSNQPEHVVSIASTWQPRLTDNVNGLFHVDMRYNSEVNIAGTPNPVTGRSVTFNPGYPLINLRVGVQSEDRNNSLEFFVENVTNQYFNITAFPVPEQTGNFAGYPSLPRFYGVRARFGF